jgi:peptidoglycan/LPS O-acetylase OafA/YrhL
LHRVRPLGWLALAGAAAFVGVLAIGLAGGQEDFGPPTDWPTMAVAVLNGLIAVTFTVWFVVWFRGRWPRHGSTVAKAARASYATYFIHPLVITAVMLAVAPVDLGAWAKFVLVSALAVPACFAVGYGLTRLPGVSTVL